MDEAIREYGRSRGRKIIIFFRNRVQPGKNLSYRVQPGIKKIILIRSGVLH